MMAVTAQQVYDMALILMDEVSEVGSINPENPENYKVRSKSILTSLQSELLPASQSPEPITDLSQNLILSDRVCLSVLPYGLAAHLAMTEDTDIAAFLNSRYEELKRRIPTTPTVIEDRYGVLKGMM